jgi:hypothetical protein
MFVFRRNTSCVERMFWAEVRPVGTHGAYFRDKSTRRSDGTLLNIGSDCYQPNVPTGYKEISIMLNRIVAAQECATEAKWKFKSRIDNNHLYTI